MTDTELLEAVEAALIGMDPFHRDLYALCRLRVRQGRELKPVQRRLLTRLLRVAMKAQRAFTPEGLGHGA